VYETLQGIDICGSGGCGCRSGSFGIEGGGLLLLKARIYSIVGNKFKLLSRTLPALHA